MLSKEDTDLLYVSKRGQFQAHFVINIAVGVKPGLP